MFEYDIDASHAVEVLDKHDFGEWLKFCMFLGIRDPWDIREKMSDWFNDSEISDALDNLSEDEFMEYLTARYDIVFDEEPIRYRARWK